MGLGNAFADADLSQFRDLPSNLFHLSRSAAEHGDSVSFYRSLGLLSYLELLAVDITGRAVLPDRHFLTVRQLSDFVSVAVGNAGFVLYGVVTLVRTLRCYVRSFAAMVVVTLNLRPCTNTGTILPSGRHSKLLLLLPPQHRCIITSSLPATISLPHKESLSILSPPHPVCLLPHVRVPPSFFNNCIVSE